MAEQIYPKRAWIPAQQSFAAQGDRLLAMVDHLTEQLEREPLPRPGRLSVVGIGASHAAAATPVYRMRQDGIDATRFNPSELPDGHIAGQDLLVLVSQSGRSAEVVALATSSGGSAYAVTNFHPSPLREVTGRGLNLGDVPDSGVSFVSFTGTILALGLLADHWAGRSESERWKAAICDSLDTVERMEADLRTAAAMLAEAPSVDFVAPAPVVSAAEEAALMFREGPRIMATGMETRQYLHGPMDAAGRAGHVVFGGSREALLIDQLAEQTRNLLYCTGSGGGEPKVPTVLTLHLPVPVEDPVRFAIGASFVAQRLTLLAAEARGIDVNASVFVRLDTKTDRVRQ